MLNDYDSVKPGQAVTCPLVYHTRWRLHISPFNAEREAEKL